MKRSTGESTRQVVAGNGRLPRHAATRALGRTRPQAMPQSLDADLTGAGPGSGLNSLPDPAPQYVIELTTSVKVAAIFLMMLAGK
jgi:hypothetical protein